MHKPLLILPFDHRSTFKKILDTEDREKIIEAKELVFEGFLEAIEQYKNGDHFGILVDEEFGAEIIKKAKSLNINTALAVEKSGQKEFEFEYGEDFKKHIETFDPTYVKVLVRYNPQNIEINKKQLEKLRELSAYCQETKRQLLFELLVPPTPKEESLKDYDTTIRPQHTTQAIKEISKQVHVDIWKLEWFTKDMWSLILTAVNQNSHVIVLGRGSDKETVKKWLEDAASYEQIIGFAVGRTVFANPVEEYSKGKLSKEATTTQIANNFREFVKLWYSNKGN